MSKYFKRKQKQANDEGRLPRDEQAQPVRKGVPESPWWKVAAAIVGALVKSIADHILHGH